MQFTNCKAEKLNTDAGGNKVTSVVVNQNGIQRTFSADTIIVSCGAINSAALFLNSANDKHPNGLANSSDRVASFFPSCGAVNPSLTIMANALRVGEHILSKYNIATKTNSKETVAVKEEKSSSRIYLNLF